MVTRLTGGSGVTVGVNVTVNTPWFMYMGPRKSFIIMWTKALGLYLT